MKRRSASKWISAGLALTMVVTMAACNNSGSGSNQGGATSQATDPMEAKQYVYKEDGTLNTECEYLDGLKVVNGRVYAYGTEYGKEDFYSEEDFYSAASSILPADIDGLNIEENIDSSDVDATDNENADNEGEDIGEPNEEEEYQEPITTFHVTSFGYNGTDLVDIKISFEQNEYSGDLTADAEGNIYLYTTKSVEDDSDPNNYVYKETYYISKYSSNGELVYKEEINVGDQADYFWCNSLICDNDANLWVCYEKGCFILDANTGKQKAAILNDNADAAEEYLSSAVMSSNGKVYAYAWDETSDYLREFNLASKTLGEKISFPTSAYGFQPGFGYDFYMRDSNGVYGYNLGDEDMKQILNFVDSDIDLNAVNSMYGIDDTHMVGIFTDQETWENSVVFYSKVDPADVPDRTILTLGCMYTDYEISQRIIKFNKESNEYRIRIVDYSQFNTDEDYTLAATQMNNDVISGKAPDIMILNYDLPIQSYMEKGVLADFTPFLDADTEIDKADILPNILEMGSLNGKIYRMSSSFYVTTMVAKTSLLGDKTTWTIEDLRDLEQSKGDVLAFSETTREQVLYYAMDMSYDQFLDLETGKCNFDSPEFIALLEYANRYPEEINWDETYDDKYWAQYDSMYREDRALVNYCGLNDFRDFNYMQQSTFGEPVTLIGFPRGSGSGAEISLSTEFGISESSKNKEAAWSFIRYFFTDEYQNEITWGWPVSIKAIDARGVEAQKRPTFENEDGELEEYDETYFIGDIEMVMEPITTEDVARVKAYLSSLDKTYNYDEGINNIINEEAASYFSGQKSAQEVVKIIQSRVQIYVNENQ